MRNGKASKFFSLIIFLTLMVTGSYIVHADTTGPALSELYPQAGSTIDAMNLEFKTRFYDPDTLDSNVIVQVDGQTMTPIITWDGIYETYYDSCTGYEYNVRTGDDLTKGLITAQFPTLEIGQHTVYYKLQDSVGNITEDTYTITISDSEGPVIVERSPGINATVNSGFATIMVKLNDANSIAAETVQLTLDGVQVDGAYDALTKTLTYKHQTVLANGSHSAQITAQDEFGNSTTTTWNFTVNDVNPPVISNFSPANNSLINYEMPTIEASITDLSGLVNPISMTVDGAAFSLECNPLTDRISYTPTAPMTEGKHIVNVTAEDLQGNIRTISWSFTIDRTGPTISNFFPPEGSGIESLSPEISFGFNDSSQLDENVVLKVDNTPVPANIAWEGIYETYIDTCTGDEYTVRVGNDYTKGLITGQSPQLSLGQHTLYYCLKDRLGNITEDTITFNVVDTSGPKMVKCLPTDGAVIATGNPTISAVLSDGNNIVPDSVYMSINQVQVNASYNISNNTITYIPEQTLLNDTYNIVITSEDELGNVSDNSWSFTINDVAPPTIMNLTPGNNSIIYSTLPTIEATLTDPSGIQNPVYLTLDSMNLNIEYNPLTGKATYLPSQPLSAGNHTVSMAVYDYQGQKSTANWQFYIDSIGPELSVIEPTVGETVATISPKVSLKFYDPSQINGSKVQMFIDGNPVNPTIEYEGIYETYYDTCTGQSYTERIGDDLTKGIISYQAENLTNCQEHTVEVTVYDKLNNFNNFNWNFLVHDTIPPLISNLTPEPDTVIENSSSTISAKVTDNNGLDAQVVTMTLNGDNVGSFDASTGVLSYTPISPLADGSYTVVASAYDTFGNSSLKEWTFSINHQSSPEINNLLPPANTGTRAIRPTISAKIKDVRGIDIDKLNMTLDGAALKPSFTPDIPGSIVSGTVYAIPDTALSSSMHEVVLTVFDLSGNSGQKTWEFGVNQFGDMGVVSENNCTTCHDEGIPAIELRHLNGAENCDLCHTYTVVGWEPDCCYCHGHDESFPPPVGNYECNTCHNTDLAWAIPTHGSPNELNVHAYGEFPQNCQQCHSSYLTREHNIYVEGRGTVFDCNTCHKSTNTLVTQAINSSNRACTACHGTVGSGHDQFHEGNMEPQCLDCHNSNISNEHLYNTETQRVPLYCSSCHESENTDVQQAITNNETNCNACHNELGNHESVHISGIDAPCLNCHAETLTADHITNRPELGLTCDSCHDPDLTNSANFEPNNIACSACHYASHELALNPPLVSDIPLYSGYSWSTPMSLDVWQGETWVPNLASYGKVIVSNHSSSITADVVWDYYQAEMTANGWNLISSAPAVGASEFQIEYTKDNRKCIIWFHSLEDHNNSIEVGSRIEIIYN